jgi:iron complex outermembrane receptor protein
MLITLSIGSFAQSFTVSGSVKDEAGAGMPGVNILEKGTSVGTTTDVDGNYRIQVSSGNAVLAFSFIGYRTSEISVADQSSVNLTMEPDVTSLGEVVVIGYGTTERKQITSSVATVDSRDFNKGSVTNPMQFLQGKVAGLSIVRPGADPNAPFDIRLRGLSTFGSNTAPLVIIDGVVGGSLQTLDPNDIESINVLKDGSAAAIYGTRGSSGVIIVTTKTGKNGLSSFDYDTFVAFESIAKSVEIASADRFIEEGGPDLGATTDWLDEVTRTAVTQSHNIGLTGGTATSNYRFSVNYRKVEGIARGNGLDQINSRLNMNHSVLDGRLTFATNLSMNLRRATFVPYEALRFALISNPTAPVYINNDPALGYLEPNTTEFHNPVAIMNETTDDGRYKTMLASTKADFEIIEGLRVSAFYSLQMESDMRSQYFSSRMRFLGSDGLDGRATKEAEDRETQLFEFTGSLNRKIGDVDLNVVGGYSYQKYVYDNFDVFNTGFITDELSYNNLGFGLGINSPNASLRGFASDKGEWLLASFFGRAMINIKDTYFVTAAYRKEGSSRFGVNNRWGDFYSISGGADLAKFFTSPFNVLKVRVGYGVTGNLPNEFYSFQSRLNTTGVTTFNDGTSERLIRLFNYVSNENPDLKWEQKAETNIGLDFGVMNNRLTGSLDVYSRTSTDILFNQPVSQPPNFYAFTLLNLGELKSQGIELVANYAVLNQGKTTFTTGVTMGRNKTEVVKLNNESLQLRGGNAGPPGLNGQTVVRAQVGQELGLLIAPRFLGLDEQGNRILEPLTDVDGDGAIETLDDYPVVGNALPDFELAWNNAFTFGNVDLSFTMRGAFGHSLANINRAYYEVPANRNNYNLIVSKYYLPNMTGNENWNSYYVERADYFKLDNMALGYSFNFTDSPFRKLRVYAAAQNLFVITDYEGVDPEVHYGGNTPLFPGVEDRNSYFRTRTFTVGLNVGF